jgi:competence protein ComEA
VPELTRSQLALGIGAALVIVVLGARYLGHDAGSAGPGPATNRRPVLIERSRAGEAVVHVVGAVRRPGVYRFPAGARVEDAVRRAGGATRRADLGGLNLAAKVGDGLQVVVPRRGQTGTTTAPAADGAPGAPALPVNLNTATLEQLDTLDGVGPATARKILAYRQQHGGFRSVGELDRVSGIGPKKLAALRSQVRV